MQNLISFSLYSESQLQDTNHRSGIFKKEASLPSSP